MNWLKQATTSAPHPDYLIEMIYFVSIQGFLLLSVTKIVEQIVQYVPKQKNNIFIPVWFSWILYGLLMKIPLSE